MSALPILIITRDPLTNFTRQVVRLWEVSHVHCKNTPWEEREIDFNEGAQLLLLQEWYDKYREPIYWFSHYKGLEKLIG